MGVIISAGHSAATAAELRAAIAAGLRAITHLHNGMPPMRNREPGLVGTALLSELWCSVIADGHHVAPEMLRLSIAARPRRDRMVLVSDAMSTVGGRDQFNLYGETIRVSGGKLVNENGSLAGAHTTLAESISFLHNTVGIPLNDAFFMASNVPFELMRIKRPTGLINRLVSFLP